MIIDFKTYPLDYQRGYGAALAHLRSWWERWGTMPGCVSWLGGRINSKKARKDLLTILKTIENNGYNLMLYGDMAEFNFKFDEDGNGKGKGRK
jgi:hypothetical protein